MGEVMVGRARRKIRTGLEGRKFLRKGEKPPLTKRNSHPPLHLSLKVNNIKCFKCLGKGHIASDVLIGEDEKIGSESYTREASITNESEGLSDELHYKGDLLVVMRLMNDQRLVKKLALPTTVHPRSDRQVGVVFTLGAYEDKVVCDFDKKVIHDGVTNRFMFLHLGHRVVLKPLSPREKTERKLKKKESKSEIKRRKEKWKRKLRKKIKESMLVNHREVRRVIFPKREPFFTIPIDRLLHVFPFVTIVLACKNRMLEEFHDVFSKDVSHGLLPLKGTEHHMNLTLGATLPNGAAHRTNPREAKEIQKQVAKLIETGWVRESMSPCVIPVIFVPKKDNYLLTPYNFHLSCKPSLFVGLKQVMERFKLGIHGKQTFGLDIPRTINLLK
ncbi:hypothetical protein CR513_26543, partial [Mucuna pruriens]